LKFIVSGREWAELKQLIFSIYSNVSYFEWGVLIQVIYPIGEKEVAVPTPGINR